MVPVAAGTARSTPVAADVGCLPGSWHRCPGPASQHYACRINRRATSDDVFAVYAQPAVT